MAHSADDGLTWSVPREITADVKAANWTWYATGPGNGIQLTRGDNKGRLVIPCDHVEANTKWFYAHVIYSDDHGKSWRLGGSSPAGETNECAVVELADGQLMLNMRSWDYSKKARVVCFSKFGGLTWTGQRIDENLIDPICQASILRYAWPEGDAKGCILFSNPMSTERERMTVRLSYDEGRTWPVARLLHDGPAAYSCLAALPDSSIACLYECGRKDKYEKIVFARFTLDWLSGGPNTE